jgi:hypothetical protein
VREREHHRHLPEQKYQCEYDWVPSSHDGMGLNYLIALLDRENIIYVIGDKMPCPSLPESDLTAISS